MKIRNIMFVILIAIMCTVPMQIQAAEPVVVVIDPGHGGANEGAVYSGRREKNLNLVIANAMYEELLKYEGISVYLTRTTEEELSLKERADFAAQVNADFVYSIHLNASADHRLFGSEVWTSAFGTYYAAGQTFGQIMEEQLSELGIYERGIKTRLNDAGDEDYYGIINRSRVHGINGVIIEHCHMDNDRDDDFYSDADKQRVLGVADATAVAKYYGLKSSSLGVDYSGYQKAKVKVPTEVMGPDTTAPEVCAARLVSYDGVTKEAMINLQASDSNGKVIYFDYSTDGGASFSELWKFTVPDGSDNGDIKIDMVGSDGTVIFRVMNQYQRVTVSNKVEVY